MSNIFGPKNEAERKAFAIEAFRVDMQMALHRALMQKGVTRAELGMRLGGKDRKYVTKTYFRDCANPSLIMLAKAFAAIRQPVDFALVGVDKVEFKTEEDK
jgi:transcriptional regulator with XRE-family HTH domain